MAGNAIAMCPPLVITEAQVDELVDKLGRALDATLDEVTERKLLVA